jgi:hypothetical protein
MGVGDFPQDELDESSFTITPSSSAFTSLNPPFTFTWSSGNIPVVLFDDAYVDEGALTQTPTTGVSVCNRDSDYASSTGAGIRTPDIKRIQVPSHRYSRVESQDDFDSFHASGSSNTLASLGTFGPRRINLKLCGDTCLSTGTSFPEIPSPTSRTADYERRSTMFTRHHARRSSGKTLPDTVTFVGLTGQASPQTRKGLSPGASLSGNDKNIVFPSLRTGPDITWKYRASELPEIPPETRSKVASDRTASWIDSHDYGFLEIMSPEHGASTDGKQVLSLFDTPTRRAILTDVNFVNGEASSPPQIPREPQGCNPVEMCHPKHFHQPKEDFTWMKDITVQCLVDQEGFRTAQPSFKLSGIVHLRSSLEPQTPGPATARFRPITRQSFHFHHAALESPPILRRVTTNYQETHDYVSRQAHLTLKYNGVYVVHGHESCIGHDGQAQKLSWQFEYLVDDRRIDVSGRVIEGEKILTPLTFSCSPELLLPAQGKRINIMHVFKKGVASKLSAEKLQPPGTLNGRPESPGGLSLGKAHGWGLHRRVQSHGMRQHKTVNSRVGIHTGTNSRRSMRTAVENVDEDEFGRHRRASSVGDHSHAASYSSKTLRNPPTIKNTVPSTVTLPLPSRHIIPPSRLAELFDTTDFSQPVPPSICEPSTFTSLTPRPRSRHAWRGKSEDFSQDN